MPASPSPADSPPPAGWHCAPGWQRVLFGPTGLKLAEWLAAGQAHVVKDGPHRTVYRVDLGERAFFVKHHRGGTAGAARRLLHLSAAQREWERACETSRREIGAPAPVAFGTPGDWTSGESILITEALEQTMSLRECLTEVLPALEPALAARLRRGLVKGLARFCAQVHEAGILHDDFHAGNVLVRLGELAAEDSAPPRSEPLVAGPPLPVDKGFRRRPFAARPRLPPQRPAFFLIDLPKVRFSRPLPWSLAAPNLAMLAAGLRREAMPSERLLFWQTYLRARPGLCPFRAGALELIARMQAHAVANWLGRDDRALRTNKDFVRIRNRHGTLHGVASLPRACLERLLADPAAPLLAGVGQPIKLSHSSVVVRALLPGAAADGGPLAVAYKRCRGKTWLKRLAGRFRPPRALRAWRLGHALLAREIATPRPLAVVAPRSGPPSEAYLAVEWLEGALDLHQYAWRLEAGDPRQRDRRARQAAVQLGRMLGRMHACGVRHRDLKANNLLAAERGPDLDLWIVDLDGVSLERQIPLAARTADLARLAASLRAYRWLAPWVRLRLLRAYLRQTAEEGDALARGRGAWKRLWQAIDHESQRHTSPW